MYYQTTERINKYDERSINEFIKSDTLMPKNYEKN